MKKKGLIIALGILGLLVLAYLMGPRPPKPVLDPELPAISLTAETAGQFVDDAEAKIPNIKPENGARVIYADDSLRQKTGYCLLYLHGFSACWMEGYPTNLNLAKEFGMNAYFPRLAGHGLETQDALIDMTPDNLWNSAKEALVIARSLGEKVIIMATSSGGTLALNLAAEHPEGIAGLILLSPNIRINNPAASLISGPWGLQLGRMISGGINRTIEQDPKLDAYWYKTYRVEGAVYLQQLIEATMKKSVFKKVNVPVFTGYYFKDEDNQDDVVKVSAILWMFDNLGTPEGLKVKAAFPDAGEHVIASELMNPNWKEVQDSISDFLVKVLKISRI